MLQQWRLIKDGPGDPAWNMAVDEALVRVHNEQSSLPILRLYTWSPPALSLGYFQKTDNIRFDELKRLGIVPVRRITGGRAVLHFGELTYSIIISGTGEIPVGVSASYRYLCRGLLVAFSMLGIDADPGSERSGRGSPDACFALSTGADIVFNRRKFVGSAQKRIGSIILQHGSILLRSQLEILDRIFENSETRSNETLSRKITCLEDILARSINPDEVAHAIIEGFAQALEIELLPDCLTDDEVMTAHSFIDKYRPVSVKGLPLKN
ncbi:MAG: biotin/lipoate A/B protein ligase family protein [Proteobacteria bacterium]|nr:biotin/lipoate A/B protein ligase family protein [Pseudomonadota bacterium]